MRKRPIAGITHPTYSRIYSFPLTGLRRSWNSMEIMGGVPATCKHPILPKSQRNLENPTGEGIHGELGRKYRRYAPSGDYDDGWASASGVQLGSGRPCHHNLGRPLPTNGTPCSQRISSSPLSTPFADTSAGFPKMAPSLPGPFGGRWTRRNGRGDALAARRHLRVKTDSETRSATGGASASAGAGAS